MSKSLLPIYQKNTGCHELVVEEIIKSNPFGGVYIDAGACIGRHTTVMLSRPDVTKVYAIEAIPELCDRIVSKLADDPRLTLFREAVGKENGCATFQVALDDIGYSGLKQTTYALTEMWMEITVPVLTLDSAIAKEDQGTVGLVKLDLEGGEFDALCGAYNLIQKSKPIIVFENSLMGCALTYNYTWNDFITYFDELGYFIENFFGEKITKSYWENPTSTHMFIALPQKSKKEEWYRHSMSSIVRQIAFTVR